MLLRCAAFRPISGIFPLNEAHSTCAMRFSLHLSGIYPLNDPFRAQILAIKRVFPLNGFFNVLTVVCHNSLAPHSAGSARSTLAVHLTPAPQRSLRSLSFRHAPHSLPTAQFTLAQFSPRSSLAPHSAFFACSAAAAHLTRSPQRRFRALSFRHATHSHPTALFTRAQLPPLGSLAPHSAISARSDLAARLTRSPQRHFRALSSHRAAHPRPTALFSRAQSPPRGSLATHSAVSARSTPAAQLTRAPQRRFLALSSHTAAPHAPSNYILHTKKAVPCSIQETAFMSKPNLLAICSYSAASASPRNAPLQAQSDDPAARGKTAPFHSTSTGTC